MKIRLLPRTNLGKWSVVTFIITWFLFVIASVLPYKTGYSGFELIIQNPLQVVMTFFILIAALASVIMGLRSVIKFKEGSILVFLAILSGLYNLFGTLVSLVTLFWIHSI